MTEIEQWLRSGAGVPEGLRLLSIYKPNPHLARMVERHPDKYAHLLLKALTGVDRKSISETAVRRPGIRETWPFLSDPDCPPELKILAGSEQAGIYAVATENGRQVFITGHSEYDRDTLKKEYFRDKNLGLPIHVPVNYFPNDDDREAPIVRWRSHANLLYANWLNYMVYQSTPYELDTIR